MNFTLYLAKAKISIYFLILVGKIAKERDIEITYYIMDLLGSLRLFKVDFNMENIHPQRYISYLYGL